MATQAKTVTIDHEDVVTTAIKVALLTSSAPVTKPTAQPVDETTINVGAFRKAIKAQFTGSRAVIDHICSLDLTSESKDQIEKLRVIFYDTWPELSYGKMGATATEAIKSRELLYSTKSADRTSEQVKIYDATKSAWRGVKEQTDLKAPAKKREPNSGTGKSAETSEHDHILISPANVASFEELATLALDVAKLIDLIATKATQAKIKSSGLVTCLHDTAKALRVQVKNSQDGMK